MLRDYIIRHISWSKSTFGEGDQHKKICNHIEKELDEIRDNPSDLFEWIDVIILALDGAWRAGYTPVQIINALVQKQAINFERKWNVNSGDDPNLHVK